ncbi:DUF6471 domain-containing protein [Paraburkholderia sp. 32]|uniref:DUF6471 domain-containing protein n=1 Tax=Paraburkholderia sp. 32 TaxID=2991057 RepID=UPI003D20CB4B
MPTDFHDEARRVLKEQMDKLGVTIEDLSELLALTGLHENPGSLYSKIHRGSFQFSFFLRCIAAMQANTRDREAPVCRVTFETVPFKDVANPVDLGIITRDKRRKGPDQLAPRTGKRIGPRRPIGRPRRDVMNPGLAETGASEKRDPLKRKRAAPRAVKT